jgi:apolipoprotein N-acyltransferase
MKLKTILTLTAISGLLTQISLSPGHIYFLSFVALVPFFIALNNAEKLKTKFLIGVLTGFFANLFGFYWMILVFKNFFFYSLYQSIGLFFIYCLIGHSQFFLFSIFFHFLKKIKTLKWNKLVFSHLILISLGFTIIDFITPKLFGDTLGNAFDNQAQLRQLSSGLGITFLTLVCSFVNSAIFIDLTNKKLKQSYVALAGVLICLCYGYWKNNKEISIINESKHSIRVAVIQPNTPGPDKINAEQNVPGFKENNANELLKQSKDAIMQYPDLDLIVWPETAYPSFFTNPRSEEDERLKTKLKSFIIENHVPVLFGLTDRDFDEKLYNSAILIQEENGAITSQIYHKVILAFMGEYNPFSKNLNSTLQTGDKPVLLKLKTRSGKEIKIAPIVCYEAMSPTYVRQAKALDPDIIIHISNESWFGYFGLPYSFLALASFRAIESEIPMIKAANSGFSGLVLPNGDIKYRGNLNDKETILMTVPIINN